jgi:hypothetical protein
MGVMPMEKLITAITLIGELVTFCGMIIPVLIKLRKITDGTRCQLRSEMLQIYYRNIESGKIRQYEYENFVMLYDAYKALKGNSFIDKIYSEVKKLEIIT